MRSGDRGLGNDAIGALWSILDERQCCANIYTALRWMNPTKGVAAMIFKSSHNDQFSM